MGDHPLLSDEELFVLMVVLDSIGGLVILTGITVLLLAGRKSKSRSEVDIYDRRSRRMLGTAILLIGIAFVLGFNLQAPGMPLYIDDGGVKTLSSVGLALIIIPAVILTFGALVPMFNAGYARVEDREIWKQMRGDTDPPGE
jgi:hypothetical protein